MRRRGSQRPLIRNPFHTGQPRYQQFIRLRLDPIRDRFVRRPTRRRVVFEAAILRRIVRRRDDYSINRMGNDGRRRVFVSFRDHHVDPIGGQYFERSRAGRHRQRMGIDSQIKWSGYLLLFTVQANRLGNREDMPFIERAVERRTAMPGGAEGNPLRRDCKIGHLGEVRGDESRHVDQNFRWRRFSRQRTDLHGGSSVVVSSSPTFASRRR